MNARFTMTMYDARQADPTFWDWLDWSSRTEDFKAMLISMWDVYEISGETINEQKKFMLDTFNEYKDLYEERLTNYEKNIDWLPEDGVLSSSRTHGDTSEVHVELPNKQIDPNDIFSYPNDGVKTTPDVTTDDKSISEQLAIRRSYLNQIKNYYREFALRFATCFIHMF